MVHVGTHVLNIFNQILFNMRIDIFLDSSINAPPSFKPAKKYSDISGLPVSVKIIAFKILLKICFFVKS